ncbi:response regulator [Wolbachia endosymbiont of Pentidionis agamae]|uniref:response regulator n=1 Tax=Wolbachia endosymbiont of Pentidionis agamae TaxID=3110435 RepID=UPI002FD02531
MRRRYIDSKKENRVDFVFRNYGLSAPVATIIIFLPSILISVLYFFSVYNQYINIEINLFASALVTIFIIYRTKYDKHLINSIEFQNAIFANALNHDTEFCLIIYKDKSIIYSDARFYERFKNNLQNNTLSGILSVSNVTDEDKKIFYNALSTNSSAHAYISFNVGVHKSRNFPTHISSNDINVVIDGNKTYNLFLSPIARPQGYFVLKALRITKEQVYKTLIENHNIGTYVTNTKKMILSVNQAFLEMFELEKIQKGSLLTDFTLKNQINDSSKSEALFITKQGTPFRANISQAIFYDKYNQSYIYGIVTLLKSTIDDYKFHPCFINASIAIAQCDKSGSFVKKNIALTNLSKLKENSIFSLVSPEYHDEIQDYLSSDKINSLSVNVKLNNDEDFKLYFNKFIQSKNIIIFCYFIDNTEHKNLEIKLEHYQKMQAIGQLAGGIAHDFNNILTAIIGFCDLLLIQHPVGDPSSADIVQIQQNANRGSNLVKQLLAFSRKQTLLPKIIDVNSTIADLSEMIKRLIGENIKFTVFYEQDLGLIKADQGQLEQVIINLVVNASAAMEKGGELIIKTSNIRINSLNSNMDDMFSPDKEPMEYGNYVVIEVSDTGYGIHSNVIDKIFDPFFSTKDITSGTGLGLSTVYGIIKQTEGHIYVTSKVNCGTKFSIFLPTVYISNNNVEVIDDKTESYTRNNKDFITNSTILLIEDEDSVRVFTTRALEKKGFKVIETALSRSALEIINGDHHIDLIITDVVMPEFSGLEIAKKALIQRPDIDVIFISGYAEDTFLKNEEINLQNFDFLPKPFTLNQLISKVQSVLGTKKEKKA